jgi:hypothetical protein
MVRNDPAAWPANRGYGLTDALADSARVTLVLNRTRKPEVETNGHVGLQ